MPQIPSVLLNHAPIFAMSLHPMQAFPSESIARGGITALTAEDSKRESECGWFAGTATPLANLGYASRSGEGRIVRSGYVEPIEVF